MYVVCTSAFSLQFCGVSFTIDRLLHMLPKRVAFYWFTKAELQLISIFCSQITLFHHTSINSKQKWILSLLMDLLDTLENCLTYQDNSRVTDMMRQWRRKLGYLFWTEYLIDTYLNMLWCLYIRPSLSNNLLNTAQEYHKITTVLWLLGYKYIIAYVAKSSMASVPKIEI